MLFPVHRKRWRLDQEEDYWRYGYIQSKSMRAMAAYSGEFGTLTFSGAEKLEETVKELILLLLYVEGNVRIGSVGEGMA